MRSCLKTGAAYIQSLRKKCPYSELFWSSFSRIWTEYGEIRSICPYSVQMRENADQNNPKQEHFSRSEQQCVKFSCQSLGHVTTAKRPFPPIMSMSQTKLRFNFASHCRRNPKLQKYLAQFTFLLKVTFWGLKVMLY